MKKLISLLVVILLFMGGSIAAYQYFYGGATYYTKITTIGEKQIEKNNSGQDMTSYNYEQATYTKDGSAKDVVLREYRNKPLKLNAYLKLKDNPRKGVMSWEEVTRSDVPKKAIEKLEK